MAQTDRPQVLVLGPEERARALSSRLSLLGCCRGLPAADLEGALRAQAAAPRAFAVGFLASDHGLPDLSRTLQRVGEWAASSGIRWVAFGPRPGPEACAGLREAGVQFSLFDPNSDEELRFVAGLALHGGDHAHPRAEERMPADLPARILTRNGEKVALIHNLSATGAYVATPRPTLRGGTVRLHFALPAREVQLDAQVLWNNVPGNLRRLHAPIGMGLRFVAVPPDVERALTAWVEERGRSYRL